MDKREQIARMAQTKEDEMLLARVYERMTNAAARSIPASTCCRRAAARAGHPVLRRAAHG